MDRIKTVALLLFYIVGIQIVNCDNSFQIFSQVYPCNFNSTKPYSIPYDAQFVCTGVPDSYYENVFVYSPNDKFTYTGSCPGCNPPNQLLCTESSPIQCKGGSPCESQCSSTVPNFCCKQSSKITYVVTNQNTGNGADVPARVYVQISIQPEIPKLTTTTSTSTTGSHGNNTQFNSTQTTGTTTHHPRENSSTSKYSSGYAFFTVLVALLLCM
eukprot:TRINITY_DN191_c0_g1_i3.p1 TRINITY_DN191_c0_g1~~TRINITY_DN191_c0_g1_i3.p1  ORF type:complete len:213 (-),score=37.94 TRINITY_DN191_c0_g1_i3:145-783(-)